MTASEMGKLGAQARIKATTSEERKAWARKAGKASGKARRKKGWIHEMGSETLSKIKADEAERIERNKLLNETTS